MRRKDSLYLVLDTSEVSSAFTMKTKGSHPFFSMGSTLKVLLLERLVRKKNYFDLRVKQKKASRRSLPQQLAEQLSWTLPLISPRYLRDLHYIHGDLLRRFSAALCVKCHHLLNWTGLLNWERHAQTFLVSCQPSTTSHLWVRYQLPSGADSHEDYKRSTCK